MKGFAFCYDRDRPQQGLKPFGQPLCFRKTGPLTAIGSLRLSNAADMRAALGLVPDADDAEILVVGWQSWGSGLADRLRGDFAFAIADASRASLYVARDPLGVMPCYYHSDGAIVRCADSSATLRAHIPHPLVPDRIPLLRYLDHQGWGHRRTFFEGIERLPPGHYLEWRTEGPKETRYWSAGAVPRRHDTANAVEEFRALFDTSVAHANVPGRTGLLLSGGLDSSAIAGTLATQFGKSTDLSTVTLTYRDTAGWNDREHVDALRAAYDFRFHDLPLDAHDPLTDADFYLSALDGPWFSYGQDVSFGAKRWLREQGCDIVLTGHGGDEIVSHGLGRLNELARAGRWLALARESRAGAALQGMGHLQMFLVYTDHVVALRRLRRKIRSFARPQTGAAASILNEDIQRQLAETYPAEPISALKRHDHDDRMIQEEAVTSALYAKAFETIALSSRALGLETRMPFCDRDLLELSLSLPSSAKLRDGWTRRILREAMRGRVPQSVLRRRDKYDFGDNFVRGLMARREWILDETAPGNTALRDLLNTQELQRLRDLVSQNGNTLERMDAYLVWRVVIAARWLKLESNPVSAPIAMAKTQ